MRLIQWLAVILMTVLLTAQYAVADEEEVTEDANGNLPFGYVRSVDAINSGVHATGLSLSMAAEYALQHHYYDQAIKLCQLALQKLDDDADIHMAYADALEHKLRKQKEKDPLLYMAAVREWLIVARQEKGEDKGLTNSKGIGLPGVQHLMQDEERSMPAMAHVVGLVGFAPKANEPDMKFMRRVAKQVENVVKGKIVPGDSPAESNSAKKTTAQSGSDSSKNESLSHSKCNQQAAESRQDPPM